MDFRTLWLLENWKSPSVSKGGQSKGREWTLEGFCIGMNMDVSQIVVSPNHPF